MFYWFTRGIERMRYEVREVSPTHFQLTITGPDGVEQLEQFDDAAALHRRQVTLERELTAHGWVGPHGWII